jgi:CRP/FNR family transcriptional regulator, cyclic AMP receptor protein
VPDLSLLAKDLDAEHFSAGHRFFGVGDHGDDMYVVSSGEVEITLRGKVLETVHAGGIFGELALIDHRERSADVIAKTDVNVGVIHAEKFMDLVRNHPYFALEVMTIMAHRLRRLDDLI